MKYVRNRNGKWLVIDLDANTVEECLSKQHADAIAAGIPIKVKKRAGPPKHVEAEGKAKSVAAQLKERDGFPG